MCNAQANVRFVPTADIGVLIDHLVGTGEKRWRHGKTKRPSGLKIDHQFKLGRRLHRQIGRLLALEDAIDIAGRLTVLVDKIRTIRHEAAGGGGACS